MRARQRAAVKWLAVVAAIGMFVVLLSGVTVTDTGSGEGCGTSWPLCHGEFIPEFALATAIEYSHRAITSIAGILIVATAIGVLAFWRHRPEIRVLVPLMLLFLVLQAALGALAVRYPAWWGRGGILALHFGISLVAFATTLLTATLILQIERGSDSLRDRAVPRGIALGTWGLAAYTYGVVYLGAYVSHTNASLACLDWPLCQGSVFPGFTGPVGTVFSHRLAALILTLGIGALAVWCWRHRAARPDLAWAAAIALVTLLLQSAAGAAIVFSRLHLYSALAHSAVVTLFFGALAYLCLHVLPRPAAVRADEQASGRAGEGASARIGDGAAHRPPTALTHERTDALTH
jgi:cytochrome c oxidase assembly protein subunit 15